MTHKNCGSFYEEELKMEKIILSISAIFLFAAMPAFAQNAQKKANEINDAGKNAVHSQSAAESRNINNAAWDGSDSGGGTPDGKNGTIDIIGGNNPDKHMEDNPSTFDKPESEDVTPWKKLITAMLSTLAAASALLVAASALMIKYAKYDWAGYTTLEIANKLGYIAAALFAAVLAMSVVLMVKHKQYLLGGMWGGLATLGIASSLTVALRHDNVGCSEKVWYTEYAPKYIKTAIIGIVMAMAGFAGTGTLSYYSYQQADQHQSDSK